MLRKCSLIGICGLLVLLLAACAGNTPSNILTHSSDSLMEASSLVGAKNDGSDAFAEEKASSEQKSYASVVLPPSETREPVQSQSISSRLAVASAGIASVEPESLAPASSQEQLVSSVSSALPEPEKQITVTLAIYGVGGELMADAGSIQVREGSTVFTVLRDYAEQTNLELGYSGGVKRAYVEGIGGLYALDYGAQSGWLYRVNGSFGSASISCGSYPVYDGDCIEWLYTIDMGSDVGVQSQLSF